MAIMLIYLHKPNYVAQTHHAAIVVALPSWFYTIPLNFCSLRRDPDANKWPHTRQPLCIHLMSNTMRTLDAAMQMWDSRTSRSYLCSLDWSDTCLKASAQSPTMLELIFLSHDQGGHRVSEAPPSGRCCSSGCLKAFIHIFSLNINIEKCCHCFQ